MAALGIRSLGPGPSRPGCTSHQVRSNPRCSSPFLHSSRRDHHTHPRNPPSGVPVPESGTKIVGSRFWNIVDMKKMSQKYMFFLGFTYVLYCRNFLNHVPRSGTVPFRGTLHHLGVVMFHIWEPKFTCAIVVLCVVVGGGVWFCVCLPVVVVLWWVFAFLLPISLSPCSCCPRWLGFQDAAAEGPEDVEGWHVFDTTKVKIARTDMSTSPPHYFFVERGSEGTNPRRLSID